MIARVPLMQIALSVLLLASPLRAAIYFGDIHAHSDLSNDATGTPDNFFVVARDVVGLDFVVLSDHDVFLTPEEADINRITAASFNQEGRFVTFSGVEWTHRWHMNAYFRPDDVPYCLSATSAVDCGLAEVFYDSYGPVVLRGDAAAHVNHPAAVYKVVWDQIDDHVTTNVEVWNTDSRGDNEPGFGNARWALQTGFRLGLVGVSDDHHTDEPPVLLGTGLTGCRVDALARADLLAALRERRCYATNGERIQLDFDVDGTLMGGELSAPLDSTVTANVSVMGTDTPSAIEILQNGVVVARKTDCAASGCMFSAPVPVTDLRNFVYARVQQQNNGRAWSSPVWVRGTCAQARRCRNRLAPGGGPKSLDCLAAWTVPPRQGRRYAPRRLTCTDGEACDTGSEAGECTLQVGLCLGINLRGCSAAPITSIEIVSPGASESGEADAENRKTLLAAAHALGPSPAPGSCSPLFPMRVPVETSSAEKSITGTRQLELVARNASGDDRDRLLLRCKPSRP